MKNGYWTYSKKYLLLAAVALTLSENCTTIWTRELSFLLWNMFLLAADWSILALSLDRPSEGFEFAVPFF